MKIRRAEARERKNGAWYVICPLCKSRINLDECPIPAGMTYNVEFCNACGTEIEIYPPSEKSEA
jgi:rRNA maturation endonuclease Nob1